MTPDPQTTVHYICIDCNYRCLKLSQLKLHTEIHLPRSERKTFKCNICGAV